MFGVDIQSPPPPEVQRGPSVSGGWSERLSDRCFGCGGSVYQLQMWPPAQTLIRIDLLLPSALCEQKLSFMQLHTYVLRSSSGPQSFNVSTLKV